MPERLDLGADIFKNLKEDTKHAPRRRAYSDSKQVEPDTPTEPPQKVQQQRKRDAKNESKQLKPEEP